VLIFIQGFFNIVVTDFFGSLLRFPVWWYGKGLIGVISGCAVELRYRAESYGFRIWIRNFFVPMYGQHDLTGRLVSVVMRSVVLFGRSIAFVIEVLLCGVWIFGWMIILPLFIVLFFANFFGVRL
jgi:hypothetical protein